MGWRGFLEQLIEKARPEDQAELRDLLQQRRFLEMASLLEYDIGIGPGGLAQHIQREFARPNKPAPEVYKLVAALPTDHFATTNYDPWLKNAVAAQVSGAPRVYVPGDHGAFTDIAPSSPPLVLMLHGDADRPDTCVLSQRAYRRTQYLPAFRRGMEALAAQRTFLFVGHSLSDPDLVTVLEEWAEVFSPGGAGVPRHVLLGAGLDRATTLRLRELGVDPIEYGKGNDHSALPSVLRFLATPPGIPAPSGAGGSGGSPAKGPGRTDLEVRFTSAVSGWANGETSSGTAPAAVVAGSLAAPTDHPLRPRVLFAGPWFGVRKELQRDLAKLGFGASGSDDALYEAVLGKLESDAPLARAQLAAILRYDLIIDLSPWRSFERWMSVGFRDVEQVLAPGFSSTAPDSVGVFGFGPETPTGLAALISMSTLTATESKSLTATTAARLESLQGGLPGFVDRLLRDAGDGIALAGFGEDNVAFSRPWFERMAGAARLVLLTTATPRWLGGLGFKATRSSASLEPALDSVTVADYLRALRVVAGQVRLLGELKYRPLEDVFVELDLHQERTARALAAREDEQLAAGKDEQLAASERDEVEPRALARQEEQRERDETRLREAEDFASAMVSAEQKLTATELLTACPRLYLEGVAGTGKSTLLRWLAVLASRAAERGGPLPFWMELASLPSASSALPEAITAGALQATRLPAHGPATEEFKARILRGEALLLLDGLDEASPITHNALATRLEAELPADCRIVLSSRPLQDRRAQLAQLPRVHLRGLAPDGARRFLAAYFRSPPWQSKLMDGLAMLPDGERWERTPVLLALAATHIAADRELPEHTLELYEQSITRLLSLGAPRAGVARTDGILQRSRQRLQRAAHRTLLPREAPPRTLLARSELGEPPERDIAVQSGLFSGGEELRFSHLTLGEYLAAAEEIRIALTPEGLLSSLAELRHNSELLAGSREALAIAHALAGEAALLAALQEAEGEVESDPSHARLGLVLRALVYGGDGARLFVERYGGRVISAVAAVFQLASARFGEHERRVGVLAERAVRGTRGWWPAEAWRHLAQWQGRIGALGLEVHVMAWWLGAKWPLPVGASMGTSPGDSARIWAALSHRDAMMPLARRLEELQGGSPHRDVRAAAVAALANHPDAVKILAPLLQDLWSGVRAAAVTALAHQPNALDLIPPLLQDPLDQVRAAAVTALAQNPDALALLVPLLEDPSDEVRAAAVAALAYHPGALDLLLTFLEDPIDEVRAAAVTALAHHPGTLDLLLSILKDPEPDIRAAAVTALAHHPGTLDPTPILEDFFPNVRAAAVTLLAKTPEASARILPLLEDPDWDIRAAAVTALAKQTEASAHIIPLLKDPYPVVRAAAVAALVQHPDALSVLAPLLEDPVAKVRAAAAVALAHRREALDLSDLLQDPDEDVQATAVASLAERPDGWNLLVPFLQTRKYDVLAAAAAAVARQPHAFSLLLPSLKSQDDEVPPAVAIVLANLPNLLDTNAPSLSAAEGDVRAAIATLAQEPDALFFLSSMTAPGRERGLEAAAIAALAHHPNAAEILRPLLADAQKDIRAATVTALARHADALDLIPPLLKDVARVVRIAAIAALAPHPNAPGLILPLLNDREAEVRAAAAAALGQHSSALEPLLPLLQDPWSTVRAAAAAALAHHPNVLDLLSPMLQDSDGHVRASVIASLAPHPNSLNLFPPFLHDDWWPARAAAIAALTSHPDALTLISPLLRDSRPGVRTSAITALSHHPGALDLLRSLLIKEPEPNVRDAAIAALRARSRPSFPAAPALRRIGDLERRLGEIFGEVPDWTRTLANESLSSLSRSPRPLHFDDDPALCQQMLSSILRAMTAPASPSVSSEPRESVGHLHLEDLGERGRVLWIHVQMDPYELHRQRNVPVSANILRAYERARFLTASRPTWVILACVDIAPDDVRAVIPSFVEQLATSQIAHLRQPPLLFSPLFCGFALPHGAVPTEPPAPAALFAADLRRRWSSFDDEQREDVLAFLSRQARSTTAEPWMLVAPLAALSERLPPKLVEALRARLPGGIGRAAELLEQARSGPGPTAMQLAAEPTALPPPAGSAAASSPSSSIAVRAQHLADQLLEEDATKRPAPGTVADQLGELASHLPSLEAGDLLRLFTALDAYWALTSGSARSQLAQRVLTSLDDLPFTDPKVLRRRSGLLSPLRRYLHEQG